MAVLYKCMFTGRNEVLAKVMFLQASVILSTEGGVVWSGGVLQFFFEGWSLNFRGVSKFSGGCSSNFSGGGPPIFWGSQTGYGHRSAVYASYWNAFLFTTIFFQPRWTW